jgi:hypothetical protein
MKMVQKVQGMGATSNNVTEWSGFLLSSPLFKQLCHIEEIVAKSFAPDENGMLLSFRNAQVKPCPLWGQVFHCFSRQIWSGKLFSVPPVDKENWCLTTSFTTALCLLSSTNRSGQRICMDTRIKLGMEADLRATAQFVASTDLRMSCCHRMLRRSKQIEQIRLIVYESLGVALISFNLAKGVKLLSLIFGFRRGVVWFKNENRSIFN